MHYEEELDLFCRCIRANISIMLQFMRLIVHFYSELTLNHHRVFVITSFCDHMCILWAAAVHYKSSPKNPRLCNFSRDCIFKIAQLCGKTATLATLVQCTLITYEYTYLSRTVARSLFLSRTHSVSLVHSLSLSLSQTHSLSLSVFASLLSSPAPHNHTIPASQCTYYTPYLP